MRARDATRLAQIAVDIVLVEAVRHYIGAYLAVLNGADLLVFTGGIGENGREFREQVCRNMDYAGIKLDAKRMEFFLMHSMLAVLQEILRVKIQWDTPAFQTHDFVHALQPFPDHVIPPHRRQRTYLSAILARNEVNRLDPYNRKLFVRVRRGYYVINPVLEVELEGRWINVYDLIHINELEKEKDNVDLNRFVAAIREWREKAAAADSRTDAMTSPE